MLSILIPIYNWNCVPLVTALVQQGDALGVCYEIVCFDDASQRFRTENRAIASMPRCRYEELPRNLGWRKVRNLLGLEAQYDYLLFLDCDLMPTDDTFLAFYLRSIDRQRVVVGGVRYPDRPPARDFLLRYRFGKQREERPALERNKHPYRHFNTFNFLIPRLLFLSVGFDESIRRYGHDDTLFGIDLRRRNVVIYHIDASVCHADIDSNRQFVEKTESAIDNLFLIQQRVDRQTLAAHFRLPQLYGRLKVVAPLIGGVFSVIRPFVRYALVRGVASVALLDLYKLGYYCCRMSKAKK